MFSLSGNGTAPGVGLAPTSLDFGNQLLATTSAPMTVTLTNTGAAALTINSFAASSDFAATSTGARDRKSTRLNSSHGYISYAVFCLKKKTNGMLLQQI